MRKILLLLLSFFLLKTGFCPKSSICTGSEALTLNIAVWSTCRGLPSVTSNFPDSENCPSLYSKRRNTFNGSALGLFYYIKKTD